MFSSNFFKLDICWDVMEDVKVRLRYGPSDPEYRLHMVEDESCATVSQNINMGELEISIENSIPDKEGPLDFYQVRDRGTRLEIVGKRRDGVVVPALVAYLEGRGINLIFCGKAENGYIHPVE